MSDQLPTQPGQEDAALPPELAPLDRALLAEGRRWRRTEPSTAGLERHVRALVQAGGPRSRSEDAMLTERAIPDHTPDPRPIPSRRPPSRWRGPLALVATMMLIALAASIFAFLRTGATGTGGHQQGQHATPTPGLTRIVAMQPHDPALHLPAKAYLSDLSFSSAHDGWAVGGTLVSEVANQPTGPTAATLIHYHDGVWVPVTDTFPNIHLDGVSMVSEADGWAVGGLDVTQAGQAGAPIVLHYLSGHWVQVNAPALAGTHLRTVHMFSPDSGYITGVYDVAGQEGGKSIDQYAFVAIYQNGVWSPIRTSFAAFTSQVVMVSDSEGWASVMKDLTKPGGVQNQQTTIYHYLSGVWTPSITFPGAVASLSAASRVDVFALATQCANCSEPSPRIEHYNGTSWARMTPPDESDFNNLPGFQHSMLISQTIYDGASSGVWISYMTQDTDPANQHPYTTATWVENPTGDGWRIVSPVIAHGEVIALAPDGNGGFWALAQGEKPLTMTILYTQGTAWTVFGRS